MAPSSARSSPPATTGTAATRSPCGGSTTPWAPIAAGRPSPPLPAADLAPGSHKAPAAELAARYHQRWEFETALDELKTHQRGPGVVLRSRSPDMVTQELWGMLLVHHAIRRLLHQAALAVEVDPDRRSFTRSLRIIRRQSPPPARRPFPLSHRPGPLLV
jgi:hypothetical protein